MKEIEIYLYWCDYHLEANIYPVHGHVYIFMPRFALDASSKK